jgi:hypothetical protein
MRLTSTPGALALGLVLHSAVAAANPHTNSVTIARHANTRRSLSLKQHNVRDRPIGQCRPLATVRIVQAD